MSTKASVTCERIKACDLQPGDLFSTVDINYWTSALNKGSIGECVYIRTNVPANYANDADTYVYRITIHNQQAAQSRDTRRASPDE